MTKDFVYEFIKQYNLAVISTISLNSKPEAALIGIAVSEDLEIIFDTVKTSRKYQNLLQNPSAALVIGWDNETTVQYEGIATELNGADVQYYKEIYFEVYPDGRERDKTWPDIVHFKITPKWIRYSNFNEPVIIEEMNF
jgi:pyridoxine/pyridoxamine 5'-phosphate oxidase